MIYIFAIDGTQWVNIGYTSYANPWDRVKCGFWTNAHPKELCGHLSDLTFLHAFEGDLKFETMLKLAHPPDHGEFWRKHKLPKILEVLNLLTTEIPNTWTPITPEVTEKMPCRGGEVQ